MDNQYNIFAKKEKGKNNLDKKILSSIPKSAIETEDKDLALSKMEMRWRIFKIPEIQNEIVEMSYKKPDEDRMYMSQGEKWVKYNDDGKYDQYIVKTYYYYQ